MNANTVISRDRSGKQKRLGDSTGSLVGCVPIGRPAEKPTVERDSTCLFWPHAWEQDGCHIAVDGYIVWRDNLVLGHSQDDMHEIGAAILKDPEGWLREVCNGCFNVVVHDYRRKRTLFLSDRFGFLPLYILRDKRGWWFAGDLESLRSVAPYQLELDKTGLAELYWFGYQIGNRTAYQHVQMMPAGTIISVSWLDGSVTERPWINITEECGCDDYVRLKDAPAQYIELVTAACNRLHNPSLRYGVTLSGGMDSRMIAACWQGRPMSTYTWGDKGSVEVKIAANVARRLGCRHTEIPVQGNFFSMMHPPMFRKYGLMEFVSGIGIPHMLNDGTQIVFDGILNDRLFAIVRKCAETLSESLRWTLGLRYEVTRVSMSSDALAETIYNSIKKPDGCISFIKTSFRREIDSQRDRVLHDLSTEIDKFRRDGDSMDELVERVMVNNRVRRFVALMCALSRPQIQTCFPFLDRDLLEYSNRIRFSDKANKRFLIRVYSEQLPHLRDIPTLMSLLPFAVPRYMHCYGRMCRRIWERLGEKALRLSRGHIRLTTMDAFRWEKWLACNSGFREGIMDYLADSRAVDPHMLSEFMHSASRYHTWVGARLMLAVSYGAWYKPEYAGSA